MANYRGSGKLRLEDFTQIANQPNVMSRVLNFRAVAGEYYLLPDDQMINLFIPAKQTFEHGGSGAEDFTVDFKMVDNTGLSDDQAVSSSKGTVAGIDYANKVVTVNHDTEESIDIYYLCGEGTAEIVYVPPIALGSATKKLLSKSFMSINAKDQFDTQSMLTLTRPFIIPEKHHLQLRVDTPANIAFPPNGEVGDVYIPFKATSRSSMPSGIDQRIINSVTN